MFTFKLPAIKLYQVSINAIWNILEVNVTLFNNKEVNYSFFPSFLSLRTQSGGKFNNITELKIYYLFPVLRNS